MTEIVNLTPIETTPSECKTDARSVGLYTPQIQNTLDDKNLKIALGFALPESLTQILDTWIKAKVHISWISGKEIW